MINLKEQKAQGILSIYNFKSDDKILNISCKNNLYIYNFFHEKGIFCLNKNIVDCEEITFLKKYENSFNYVIALDILEIVDSPVDFLKKIKRLMKQDAHLLLGTQNRLALKFFVGDKDPFSLRCFDGIENYIYIDDSYRKLLRGRCYAKSEIISFIEKSDFKKNDCYSVLPSLEKAHLIFSDDYMPKEDLALRCSSDYFDSRSIFLKQEKIYTSLISNNMFHQMADSYIFDCYDGEEKRKFNQITLSCNRCQDLCFATIVYKNDTVYKKALYASGLKQLEKLDSNHKYLQKRGIKTIDGEIIKNSYVMPYVNAELANVYLRDLASVNKEEFIIKMDLFKKCIEQASDIERIDSNYGVIAKKAFLDMNPLNAFAVKDEFVFFDQEFYQENYPVNAIVYRFLTTIYEWDHSIESIIPLGFFMDRYDLWKQEPLWREMSDSFVSVLENNSVDDEKNHSLTDSKIFRNRFIVNFSGCKNNNNFLDSFMTDQKDIIIVGNGNCLHKFVLMYKNDCNIKYIISDISLLAEKYEFFFSEIADKTKEISQLEKFIEVDLKSKLDLYKFILCDDHPEYYFTLLYRLGVKDVSLYDANKIYSGRQVLVPYIESNISKLNEKKKYHIGYIAGVFDLFHLGHLNMFRRAKEQCEYLIVGVTSDRYVIEQKKKTPFIPFEERIEMVRSCKYVDEAVEIPFEYGGTKEAFEKYHFDVQFSGSDYVNDSWWLEQQQYLRNHGADLVFLSYTQQTSSTKIKGLIEKGLL